jgi:hypothetical protein
MNNTVCLCGSTKYLDAFHRANVELTKRGLSVITISMALPRNEDGSQEDAALKEMLDLVHFNKILRADAVFLVADYMGRSTAREVIWASMQGKPVIEWSHQYDDWDMAAESIKSGSWRPGVIVDASRTLREVTR